MTALQALFPQSATIDRMATEEHRVDFAAVPGKAAVYLLTGIGEGGAEQPVLLATVGDLRAALRRRLADTPADVKSKRVAYGQICARVHWREVHSAFAANFYYAAAARALFPQTAAALIPWRAAWWIAVERPGVSPFPRFRKTNHLSDASLAYAGPIFDKHAAQRLVESLEDLFDLCRYHNILVQAPNGKACAYKEMGKCPAPCDGSVSLESYRGQIDAAFAFASNETREAWREGVEAQMKAAAGALQFEAAARLKQRLTRAGVWQGGAAKDHRRDADATARLEEFAFLSLQPGKGKPWVEPWVIHFARGAEAEMAIQALPQFNVRGLAEAAGHLAEQCRHLAGLPPAEALSKEQTLSAALVAHHLFKADADHGIWLRLRAAVDPAAIVAAVERLRARKAPKPMAEQSSDVTAGDVAAGDVTAGDVAASEIPTAGDDHE